MPTNEHRSLILDLVELLRPNTYVELGVQYGYVFNLVSASGFCERCIAVDKRMKSIKRRPCVSLFQMSTDEFFEIWKEPIDFLFIDADHSYEQVKKDFLNFQIWVPYHKGLILLHDTHPQKGLDIPTRCGDSWKFAQELHLYYPLFEVVTIPGKTCGLSIIRHVTNDKHMEWA